MSDAIFVVGYYRSGTSALSGTLQTLGVALHNDANPNEHNPRGFFEIPELIEFDVDLFARLGRQWTDLRSLEEGWNKRADMAGFLSRLGEILRRRFQAEPLWGIKHPHICRLLPIYEEAAKQAGHAIHVLHISRDPWTVADSQQRKNGLSRSHALLLWVSYMVSAERHARHLPRSWLTYRDLLKEPITTIRRIEADLGIPLISRRPNALAQAKSFLTTQLDRSKALSREGLLPGLDGLVERLWQALQDKETAPSVWDSFACSCTELVGFVAELAQSKGSVMPWVSQQGAGATGEAAGGSASLRPAERLDPGGRARLLARKEALEAQVGPLPRVAVLIAAPPSRAHAVNETLQSLRSQWHPPSSIQLITTEEIDLPDLPTIRADAEAGALTIRLCAVANAVPEGLDYVAILNAGDTVAPDACLRLALEAQASAADLIYTDEIVQRDIGPWIRHKPGWEPTRLRQSPYIGDWVWYRMEAVHRVGGFDAALAGAEEYDLQLRLAEAGGRVVRLTEAVFTRSPLSRRDNIPSTIFVTRAAEAIASHLARIGQEAQVESRQYQGLYRHVRKVPDEGTTTILLCDGAEIAGIDHWLRDILSSSVLTGPIILAGAALAPQVVSYFTQVIEKEEALEHKVLAVPPADGIETGDALAQALLRVATPHVLILDARGRAMSGEWQAELRARLADPRVGLVGARGLSPLLADASRFTIQGPIVIGADARMGAGHLSDDPGPGGWLMVDQEASALAPPALLARAAALAACRIPSLSGDALWIDIGAQLRVAGHALVWTPDVSFAIPGQTIRPDFEGQFRRGSEIARTLSWEDPFHHPALSLHGDLLTAEQHPGLVRAAPVDPGNLLLSGPPEAGLAVFNAARALRTAGLIEASWTPEIVMPGQVGRRAPKLWLRVNPAGPEIAGAQPYAAIYTQAPKPEAKPALGAAEALYVTSPGIAGSLRKLLPPNHPVTLWRPTLSRPLWTDFTTASGINSRPRILWMDEGITPAWLVDLINETMQHVLWIVVEKPGATYAGSVTCIRPPGSEQGWASELASLAPHLCIRPVDRDADSLADHYRCLLAAAAGCQLLIDERLDCPPALGAQRLPNRYAAWQRAVSQAVADLHGTIAAGQAAREACLALPAIEDAPPPWAGLTLPARVGQQAAE
ncbi:MAG TPA: sulfotransferase [Acidisoma sp.]|uniref:sulfotransferase n=1 Tax=Acidisoma sp. TaxID=1872115 RepID=UPI002CA80707|nr:sulfotransferase [Acidisoma sp.]HTI00223.1 sulfotransferase [Acidisoma sp.]